MDLLTLHGIQSGSLRRRAGETTEDLMDRIDREGADILIIGEGSIPLMCAVFDQGYDVIETLIDSSGQLQEAKEKGDQIMQIRETESREAALALKEFALRKLKDEHRRITHSDDWPTDPELFHVELLALLPDALRDYNGSVIQMSEPLSATVDEIESVIAGSEILQRLQMICMTKDDAAAEANFAEKAATGPAAGALSFLKNRQSDKYGDKSTIDYKNVGFDVPPPGPPPNALFTKKEKE